MENPGEDRLIYKWIYMLKLLTNKAASAKLDKMMPGDFNMTFMPYFMNIGVDGVSNHDLVDMIMVTKQGVSKTIKELERLGLVYTEKNETDARSIMIYLTEKGKTLHAAITEMTAQMTGEYKKLVGEKKYDQFIDTLIRITEWHKEQDKL